jgi:hypothetical protein
LMWWDFFHPIWLSDYYTHTHTYTFIWMHWNMDTYHIHYIRIVCTLDTLHFTMYFTMYFTVLLPFPSVFSFVHHMMRMMMLTAPIYPLSVQNWHLHRCGGEQRGKHILMRRSLHLFIQESEWMWWYTCSNCTHIDRKNSKGRREREVEPRILFIKRESRIYMYVCRMSREVFSCCSCSCNRDIISLAECWYSDYRLSYPILTWKAKFADCVKHAFEIRQHRKYEIAGRSFVGWFTYLKRVSECVRETEGSSYLKREISVKGCVCVDSQV